MKRIYWIAVFLVVSVSSVFSQQILSDRHLEWQTPRNYHVRIDPNHALSGRYYFFEGARYFDSQTRLPWYYELIPVDGTARYRVSLDNTGYIKLTDGVALHDSAQRHIDEQVEVHARLSKGRDQAYLQVYFTPVRRNPATGELEGLEDFDLVLERIAPSARKAASIQRATTASCVLAKGDWIKLGVEKSGVYRLDYSTLEDLGMGDASSLALYGNTAGVLEIANDSTPDYRLEQVPIYLEKGPDGIFGKGDYMLFFGRDPDRWTYQEEAGRFECQPHPYSGSSYYYLTFSASGAKRLEDLDAPQ
ncbi:MAG TPA: hypothetical protein VJ876_00075, partial [Bacteroidales bacterium]|nr:hypothetical protein [Bacteroidales bacterium]